MNTQAQLGNVFFNSLVKLRQEKGSFNMDDVGALFMHLSATMPSSGNEADTRLKDGVEQLAVFIAHAKKEISALSASQDDEGSAGNATLHLDAIVKATEEAGHAILDAVDAIQNAAQKLDAKEQQPIQDAVIKIYEACNFQDLTVQRVSKVIKVLNEIDSRINSMLTLFNANSVKMDTLTPDHPSPVEDAELLNGPQLPDLAPSQIDIDALFATKK